MEVSNFEIQKHMADEGIENAGYQLYNWFSNHPKSSFNIVQDHKDVKFWKR